MRRYIISPPEINVSGRSYPQSAYYGMSVSLQNEWQHVCRIVPGAGLALGPVEEALKSFLSTLLDVGLDARGNLRELLGHRVSNAGAGIGDPTKYAAKCLETSEECVSYLTTSLRLGNEIDVDRHAKIARNARNIATADRDVDEKSSLTTWATDGGKIEEHRLERAQASGAWLTAVPNQLNGTLLNKEEFSDNFRYRFGFQPLNLPEYCDGCGETFSTEHGLNCKKGGLVNARHEDVADTWSWLGSLAYCPSAITHRPRVDDGTRRHNNNANGNGAAAPALAPVFQQNANAQPPNGAATVAATPQATEEEPDLEADKGIRGFYRHGRDCLFDIQITNTESRSLRNTQPLKVLKAREKRKKDKYERACHEKRKDFSPLIYSIDGMAGPATRAAEKKLAGQFAYKWKREFSEMCAYVRTRMSIAVVRNNTLMWRGSRAPRRAHHGFIDNGGAMDTWQTARGSDW